MQFAFLEGMLTDDLAILVEEASEVLKSRGRTFYRAMKRRREAKRSNDRANLAQATNNEIVAYNSSRHLIPIGHLAKRKLSAAALYLPALLNQDWSHLFSSQKYNLERHYYVYAHINPDLPGINAPDEAGGLYGGTPFYIGKGTDDRAYDLKRNQGHGKQIEKLLRRGYTKQQIVKIIFDGLTEAEAYEIEAKLIFFFGTIYGHRRGTLYNLDTPPTPKFCGFMKPMNLNFQPQND